MLLLALCGCASPHRVQFAGGLPVDDCPAGAERQITLSASVLPLEIPSQLAASRGPVETQGTLARRIVVSAVPAGPMRGDIVTWSQLAIDPFGGTFRGWTQVQTDFTRLDVSQAELKQDGLQRRGRFEVAGVRAIPGRIEITRAAVAKTNLLGTVAIDVLVRPGGVEINDTVVRIPQLLDASGRSVLALDLRPELVPVRHPAGFDAMSGLVSLRYVMRHNGSGGGGRDEVACTVQSRAAILDLDAVRQPYWDIGVGGRNAGRTAWLAFRAPALGVQRAVFESPAAANAFIAWIGAVKAAKAGAYDLGVFDGMTAETFSPIVSDDVERLRVGTVGER